MVKTKNQIKTIIKAFVKEVRKSYRVEQAILFGSYVSGKATEFSDIDLAIVSPDFRGRPEMEILMDLSRKAMKIDTSLEVLAFTPEELVSPDPLSFSYQVKKTGLPLAA
ncbi:MAG: nucleotidyltransferase domain-containing protein [Deltaproteobacteria bacterium]|nr:nucleotidyltransferase domain-containing protein [Deltaproteobacteria bacterium]